MDNLAVIGSTGSVGTQCLNIVRRNPGRFKITALTGNNNKALLSAQAAEFKPAFFGCGEDAALEAASQGADTVLVAVSGMAGLKIVLRAVECGVKRIALANKESLVAGGAFVMKAVRDAGTELIPVDSEHSAVFQCMFGRRPEELRRTILTASGGPLLRLTPAEAAEARLEDVLKHPTYSMGAKISVDSATMVNKGLEVIEAHHLFSLPYERIECVVHPQSVIHSVVELTDGSHFAQMSYPDMEIPISYALTYPERIPTAVPPLDFAALQKLDFLALDVERFPCFALCMDAARRGGLFPCVFNAADEAAVALFLEGKIRFREIYDIIAGVMNKIDNVASPTLDEIFAADAEARGRVAADYGRGLRQKPGQDAPKRKDV